MKRLELTPQLQQLIKDRVGEDVSLDGIAVFEAISLNNKPLPGKKGTIWEGAVATPLTLKQIKDKIDGGFTIPLQLNHDMVNLPTGRVFDAGLNYADDGSFELRTLFYLDASEAELASKIDQGIVDEVSISFLPTSYLCSECGWDYLGEGANFENFFTRTCANDHKVGEDGVHVNMVGLADLIELSLVARGAAANPKIVGRSASKLAPASAQRLAARGFEIDGLVCQASRGEDLVNTDKLVADLVAAQTQVGVLTAAAEGHQAALTAANQRVTAIQAELTAAQEQVTELETQLTAAKDESKASEAGAATTWLTASLTKLLTAAGKPTENLPTSVADLTAAIDAETKGLTAIIPAGGASEGGTGNDNEAKPAASLSAYKSPRR
jgi:hypothetical protein